MATYHASITDEQAALICNAPLFFVASADPALARGPHDVGPVNVSAKGGVPLHILGPNRVATSGACSLEKSEPTGSPDNTRSSS